jgi:choline monooxygenase
MKVAGELSFEGLRARPRRAARVQLQLEDLHRGLLEDYHVGPFHPGLGNFVTCDDLRWEFGRDYSVQTVGVAPTFGRPGSDAYKRGTRCCCATGRRAAQRGAIWLTYYPHIMVEWYPHVLTVSAAPHRPRRR